MRPLNMVVIGFAGVVLTTSVSTAQVRRVATTAADAKVEVTIALQVSAQPYRFEGGAVCQHAATASIYNVPAAMWTVRQSEGQQSLTLTLWRPNNAQGDMFSLSVADGAKSYTINTVKVGSLGMVSGSGKVTLTTSGPGGTFRVDARAADGTVITGTIKCSAFTAAVAEGGD